MCDNYASTFEWQRLVLCMYCFWRDFGISTFRHFVLDKFWYVHPFVSIVLQCRSRALSRAALFVRFGEEGSRAVARLSRGQHPVADQNRRRLPPLCPTQVDHGNNMIQKLYTKIAPRWHQGAIASRAFNKFLFFC